MCTVRLDCVRSCKWVCDVESLHRQFSYIKDAYLLRFIFDFIQTVLFTTTSFQRLSLFLILLCNLRNRTGHRPRTRGRRKIIKILFCVRSWLCEREGKTLVVWCCEIVVKFVSANGESATRAQCKQSKSYD